MVPGVGGFRVGGFRVWLLALVVACASAYIVRAPDVGSVGLSLLYATRSVPSAASNEPVVVLDRGRLDDVGRLRSLLP
jgi:hypothetical protein